MTVGAKSVTFDLAVVIFAKVTMHWFLLQCFYQFKNEAFVLPTRNKGVFFTFAIFIIISDIYTGITAYCLGAGELAN